MSISVIDPKISAVAFENNRMTVSLSDGREIAVPLSWFPRLAQAPFTSLHHWELAAAGHGLHWPELDEDISIEGLLFGHSIMTERMQEERR